MAWDQWGSNPGRAAGAVTFNVLTTVFTGGAGAGVSGAGKAGAVAKALSVAGKAGRIIDPTTYVFKAGLYTGTKIRDFFFGFKNLGHVDVTLPPGTVELPEGTLRNTDGTVTIPADATPPKGAVEQPNGTYTLTDDAVPGGSLRAPDGSDAYLTPRGDVVNGKGEVLAEAKNAPTDIVDNAATRAETPTSQAETPDTPARADVPAPERELVSVGADTMRAGDNLPGGGAQLGDSARAGSQVPDYSPRMGHNAPGGPDNAPGRNPGDAGVGGAARDVTGGGADDLSRGSSTGPEGPGGSRGDGSGGGTGGGGTDDMGRAGDDSARGGSGDTARPDSDVPVPHPEVERPSFMREGPNPYGPRGSLSEKQIHEIQVYRANNEPGYREHFYRKDGTRRDVELFDESGETPPQLTRLTESSPWIPAHEVPPPPKPHYLDADYISMGESTVTNPARYKVLDEAAQSRHFAIQWDNIVADWKADAGKSHDALATPESAAMWGEAKGTYKESHAQMGDLTEAFGEKAAEHHYIAERYPDFEPEPLIGPKNGNDQFDQMWVHKDGRVVVIEAKSNVRTELGARTLSDGRRASQGSQEYFFDIMERMRERGEFKALRTLDAAIKEGKLEYTVIKGEKNAGTYTGLRYRRFDISKGTLP
ncbi:hypothetical protein [Streptomyces sp. NPDC048442]|uniref:hypothetical protein n=1 Tax=Streptomyces sp. NPDC048442 TaxID=3154823 RepID=UPI003441E49F